MNTGEPEVFGSLQGEGITTGLPSVFVRLAECNLKCAWCFVPETPILLPDWTWKTLGEIRPGDAVVSIARPTARSRHNRLAVATVTAVSTRHAATVVVNDRVRCTPDHKFWLTGKGRDGTSRSHSGWREVERAVGLRALFTTDPPSIDERSYERGWLAGMADGDGCFWTLAFRRGDRRFRLALNDPALLERARTFAERAGYHLRPGIHRHDGFTGRSSMRCLWLTADEQARAFEDWLNADIPDPSWSAGYLGGIIDAEGSHSAGALRIAQSDANPHTRARIERVLARLEIPFTREAKGYYLQRRGGQCVRALAIARPAKAHITHAALGHHPHASRVIESVEPTGVCEPVVTLTTTTGSYVAGGFVVKNCDTKYTWDWANHDRAREVLELEAASVAELILQRKLGNVVITGGEPLLQQAELGVLVDQLRAAGQRIEIETNGSIIPAPGLADQIDQWNVSPKLASSGNPLRARIRSEALHWFASNPRAHFKFVVLDPSDVSEVCALCAKHSIARDRVTLMPEGTDAETLAERSRWLAASCLQHGFRLGTRLHVLLWGSERGR